MRLGTDHVEQAIDRIAADAGLSGVIRLDVDGEPLLLPSTTAPRTLADLLRHLPVPDSVAMADAVLRRDAVSAGQLASTLSRQQSWPYAVRAALAVSQIDPRRESWLESYSFSQLACLGVKWNSSRRRTRRASGAGKAS